MFRAEYLNGQKAEEFKNEMIFSSFGAWQTLRFKQVIDLDWQQYQQEIGLKEKLKMSKKQLENEAKQAYENAERIRKKFMKNGS